MILEIFPPLVAELILSIILGIVQGITEFLPISSTAHLLLTSSVVIGQDIGLTTSNIIQFGTLLATLQYYWADLKEIAFRVVKILTSPSEIKKFFTNIKLWLDGRVEEVKENEIVDITIAQLAIATLPVAIFALSIRSLIEGVRDNLLWVALFLILGGVLVGSAELVHNKIKKEHKSQIMGKLEVLTIGLFQCFAVFPGVSRSGSTMSGALMLGRDRFSSVRFSFLLAVPVLGLASLYDLVKAGRELATGSIPLLPTNEIATGSTFQLSLFSFFWTEPGKLPLT